MSLDAEQVLQQALFDILDVHHPLAEVCIIEGGESVLVEFGHHFDGKFSSPSVIDDFLDAVAKAFVFEHEQMPVKYRRVLFAQRLADLSLELTYLIDGLLECLIQTMVFESCVFGHFGIAGIHMEIMLMDVHDTHAEARRTGKPAEDLWFAPCLLPSLKLLCIFGSVMELNFRLLELIEFLGALFDHGEHSGRRDEARYLAGNGLEHPDLVTRKVSRLGCLDREHADRAAPFD